MLDGRLNPAEERVARAILSRYPVAGLETAQRLAGSAGVSAPTVVRFATTLGYSGYREFQASLREEVQERHASPLSQSGRSGTGTPDGRLLSRASEAFTVMTRSSFTGFRDADVETALALMANPEAGLWMVGGRFSHILAQYLHLHVRMLRPGSNVVGESTHERTEFLVDLKPGDVLIAFDYRRYQTDTIDLATQAHDAGARVVLFTDIWLSPISSSADVVLTSAVEALGAFDSLAGAMAVVETLTSELLPRLGASAEKRLHRYEAAFAPASPATPGNARVSQ